MDRFQEIAKEIIEAGHFLNQSGLCPATAGNLSMRYDAGSVAITASGKHKGYLSNDDILVVDMEGKPIFRPKKPSAETFLHLSVYQTKPDVNAVLHTHSLNGTVLSMLRPDRQFISTKGYEIHKVFTSIETHESEIYIPIFDNSQDMPNLAKHITANLPQDKNIYGYFLRGHGLYTWGRDMQEAKIRIEAFEFLFACELKLWNARNGK